MENREEQMDALVDAVRKWRRRNHGRSSAETQLTIEYCANHMNCDKCPRSGVAEHEKGCAHIFARMLLADAQLAEAPDKPTNKYNTRVRQAISDKYMKYSKDRAEVKEKLDITLLRLQDKSIPYIEYEYLIDTKNRCEKRLEELNAYVDAFDQAIEICLNIAEEEL